MPELVLASHNGGKLAEFQALLADGGVRLHLAPELGLAAPEEPAPSFVENAILKARAASRASGLPALADDSGLIVPALSGEPGVLSARYAGPGASDRANGERLVERARHLVGDQRACAFVCVLVVLSHPDDPLPLIVEGRWDGRLLDAPRGDGGFGYDPWFLDPVSGLTAAEMGRAAKNARSHRARACARLLPALAGKLAT
jgi:XTP/dITP diphosphohydrolase